MFKGFPDKTRQFNGFPNKNFQINNEAYGFSGCTFWLDAAYGTNTQTDLAAISTWKAKVGSTTYTQDTAANQLRYVSSDVNFNNLPSIQCIDDSRWMVSDNGIKINSDFTLVVVAKVDSAVGNNVILGNSSTATSPLYFVTLGGTAVNLNGFGMFHNSGYVLQGTTESTNARIIICTKNNLYINGSSESYGINTFNQSHVITYTHLNIRGTGTSIKNVGRIAEILTYDYTMNTDQISNLSTRLNSKYAIY